MPWTAETFRKHFKRGTPAQLAKAAEIANAILADGGDEGVAIATAIRRAKGQGLVKKAKGMPYNLMHKTGGGQ